MMTIGRLARTNGLEAKTLRYYDRVGLLHPSTRTPAGYRIYNEASSGRLRFILRAKALGMSLADIRRILAVRDEGLAPCRHVLDLVAGNIARIEDQLTALQTLRADLKTLRRQLAREIPANVRAADDCPCLDIIAEFKKRPPARRR